MAVIAHDSFGRTVSNGWGAADSGGSWTGSGAAFSISGGKGRVNLSGTTALTTYLPGALTDAVTRLDFSSSSAYSGGVQQVTINGRTVSGVADAYRGRVRIEETGIRLYLLRGETVLGSSVVLSGGAYTANEILHIELSVTGTSPTALALTVWRGGESKPGSPLLTASDASADQQAAGNVGIRSNLGSGASNAIFSFDEFALVDPTIPDALDTPVVTRSVTNPTTIGGSDGTYTVSWEAVPGATVYDLDLIPGAGITSGAEVEVTVTGLTHTFTGLAAGAYSDAVRARA